MKPLIVLALITATTLAHAQAPDTILFHGSILTGATSGPAAVDTTARVSALAIRDHKILATGTDAQILALKSPTTTLIDLHGAFAMPGFNDAHTHIAFAGQQKLTVDLDNVPSLAAMQQKIRDYAASLAVGAWITGGGWDHTKWPSKTLPARQDLDAVTGNHPAYLERTDGHIAIVNTAALAAAHITAATPAPAGSKIDLDAQGQPTGIIREAAALALIQAVIPPPDAATRRRALTLALADASAHGVTSVQDLSTWDDFLVLEAMEKSGDLHVRVSEWLPFNDPIATLKAHQTHHDQTDPLLHTGMLKGFMDGSLGSRTAALLAPYTDDPTNSGLPRYDQAKLNAMTIERAAAGFQIGFHAIGDRANTMALDAFAAVSADTRNKFEGVLKRGAYASQAFSDAVFDRMAEKSRFRIEHAQVVTPADFDRFAKLHIIASMQPSHLLTDMAWATDRLGPQRALGSYAWRTFLSHHITVAFGTDYPVESISPFRGLYSAVTRQNEAGTQTYQPQERLTIAEALYAYTQASAFAEFAETKKGHLTPGFLADIVVLDRDPTTATPQQLLHTQVIRTLLGGATVFTAPTTPTAETHHRSIPDGG